MRLYNRARQSGHDQTVMDSVAQDQPASEPVTRVRQGIETASLWKIAPFAVVLVALALRLAIYAHNL